MANSTNSYLHNIIGQVSELGHPYKAILTFQYHGKTERALLWADKLVVDGQNVKYGEQINEYLKLGSSVKFSCHHLNESGQDQCGYFVTMALPLDPIEVISCNSLCNGTKAFLGIYNANGSISELSQRQGVLTYVDHNEKEHGVKFMASKLFLSGKRVGAKQNLQTILSVEDKVQFDAVPCDPAENSSRCQWFATAVWKGKKPMTDYDNPSVDQGKESKSFLSMIKRIPSNPKSVFVRGSGQIMHILNEEYGIALGAIQPNVWEAVLFHRSVCFLFKLSLASQDLGKIFKEGDKVNLIAAKAPKHLGVRWIASQISVYVGSEVRDLVERCTCPVQFPMIRVSEGKYRIGDTKVLIFIRMHLQQRKTNQIGDNEIED